MEFTIECVKCNEVMDYKSIETNEDGVEFYLYNCTKCGTQANVSFVDKDGDFIDLKK